jgi:heptosyltransferase II
MWIRKRLGEKRPAPKRILVRGTNWVGDAVISIPAARELRRIFADSEIVFWAPAYMDGLIRGFGLCDEVFGFGASEGGALRRVFRVGRRLRGQGFDMVVLLQNAFESAFTSLTAGIPLRAGYPTDLRGPLLNIRIPLDRRIRQVHQVYYYLGLTDFLNQLFHGPRVPRNNRPDCSILIPADSLARARDALSSAGADLSRPLFVLGPGSVNSEAKRWPTDCFARLADLLREERGAQAVIVGSHAETAAADEVVRGIRSHRAVSLAGVTDMITSMAVMALSSMVVSNDTGSAHLAIAASAKVLTIFGPTIPGATAPFGPASYVIQGTAPCAPCRHFRCPAPGHPCMRSVTPEAVCSAVDRILTGRDREFAAPLSD